MQPLPDPDDIPTLLSRFHTWAEKQPGPSNGNGHRKGDGIEGVRELTYEEAMEQHRDRQPPQREPRTRPTRARVVAETDPSKADPSVPAAIAPAAAAKEQKLRIATESQLVETNTPSEASISSPQVELPFAAEARRAHDGTAIAAALAKKTAKPAVPLAAAKSAKKITAVKKAAGSAVRPKVPAPKEAAVTAKAAKASPMGRTAKKKPSAITAKKCARNQPEFRQVLAKSVRAANTSPGLKKTKAPDRTRRITTRFSTSEERRIEKSASLAGMTVSAWLRKCALAAEQNRTVQPQTRPTSKKVGKAGRPVVPETETRLFAQPETTSLVGGWLTLLRQRFLSSPTRFAERA